MQIRHRAALTLAAVCATAVTPVTVSASAAAPATPRTSTTTANLNVRQGPSLRHAVIGGLRRGESVQVIAEADGWSTISYGGKTAYVATQYLMASSATPQPGLPRTQAAKPADQPTTSAAGNRKLSDNVNVRRSPTTGAGIVRTLKSGTIVTTTGVSQNGFLQVRFPDGLFWMHSMWLEEISSAKPAQASAPAKPANSTKATPNRPASVPGPTPNPNKTLPAPSNNKTVQRAAGSRWTTTRLNVRSAPGTSNKLVSVLEKGRQIVLTGLTANGWARIDLKGKDAFVYSQYLSDQEIGTTTTPSPAEPTPDLKAPHPSLVSIQQVTRDCYNAVMPLFPEIKTVYGTGFRSGYSDHASGYALDFMIAGYQTGASVGDRLAQHLQEAAAKYQIHYIIWKQKIFYPDQPDRGWITMGDRGNPTANHMDHVHVSFKHV